MARLRPAPLPAGHDRPRGGQPEASGRFLYDVRRAPGDLIADHYYGTFTALCHQHGITSYMQPYDRGPMEEMQIGPHPPYCLPAALLT